MYISSNISKYIIYSEATVLEALNKINVNKSRIIFVVSEDGKLQGSLSDGDIRRWLTASENPSMDEEVKNLMNQDCISINSDEINKETNQFKETGIECIPIINKSGHLVKISFLNKDGIFVGNREISESSPAFIIAEIGNNHQGDFDHAKKLVDAAIDAGVDCIKFQMRSMKKLYKNEGDTNDHTADLGSQYTLDLLSKFQLKDDELIRIFDYVKENNAIPLCTPWDLDSLEVLEDYGMDAYKIASADFTNFELLESVVKTGKPFFCSTGMSTETEIKQTVKFLDDIGGNYVLLHCNSTYPTPFKDVNLNYISRLKKITGKLVGYSGHERGIHFPIASIALGSSVIEKHLTLDKSQEGTDHKVSLIPDELSKMVNQIRQLEEGLGSNELSREITQGEMINRENLAKSIVASKFIKKGSRIERNMLSIKSPGQGLQPNKLSELIGKYANRDLATGDFFYQTDISGQIEKKNYSFKRPFGVPVRYHDYRNIITGTNLDFVEFHLSYKDLKVDLDLYLKKNENIGFAVHSPELFQNDHILDLCADDSSYQQKSVKYLEEVISVTKNLKRYFPKTRKPVVVLNAGGWNLNGFISEEKKAEKYKILESVLRSIDLDGIQLAIQTMPPYPWHFGGQSFHNLFVSHEEIINFCKRNKEVKICLDISHSMMACNFYGWEFNAFVKSVLPYTVHMHIVDALGVDGEGVEIGKGDVNFHDLAEILKTNAKNVQFIPEVWQGHKNYGEGFWKALAFLEEIGI